MDLSVVIVSYNTREELQKCLERVFGSQTNYQFEVWVVDNASRDGSAEMVKTEFPQVKLIENQENAGYARANNQAIRKLIHNPSPPSLTLREGGPPLKVRGGEGELLPTSPRYILLLNSDVEISFDTFDKTLSFMDNNSKVGIAGCRVIKSDGSFDKASRRSFPNPKNSLFYLLGLPSNYNLDLPDDQIAEVDSVMGAFLLIRREAIERIGLLDEDFFMYGEDLDWCYRAKEAGYKVMYAPITTVVHHKGSSARKLPGKTLYEFHRAMQIFYDKHYRQKYNFLINWLVKIGIWTRYLCKSKLLK